MIQLLLNVKNKSKLAYKNFFCFFCYNQFDLGEIMYFNKYEVLLKKNAGMLGDLTIVWLC